MRPLALGLPYKIVPMKYFFCTALVLLLLIGCSRDDKQVLVTELSVPIRDRVDAEIEVADLIHDIAIETWTPLFDGESMAGWSVPIYGGDGEVEVQEGNIVIGRGDSMTGIRYEKEFPNIDYELQYEARRTGGYDFFAACTFPVKKSFCTFVNGGWGGGMVGLSSVNGYDASENETNSYYDFKANTWYRFRIQVKSDQIQVWIATQDKEGNWEAEKTLVDLAIDDKTQLSTRMEVSQYKPLGFCTWSTEGQLRNIEYRTGGHSE